MCPIIDVKTENTKKHKEIHDWETGNCKFNLKKNKKKMPAVKISYQSNFTFINNYWPIYMIM